MTAKQCVPFYLISVFLYPFPFMRLVTVLTVSVNAQFLGDCFVKSVYRFGFLAL